MKPTNYDLVKDHATEAFKENLRQLLISGAALLSLDELKSISNKVYEETISFLASSADGSKGE